MPPRVESQREGELQGHWGVGEGVGHSGRRQRTVKGLEARESLSSLETYTVSSSLQICPLIGSRPPTENTWDVAGCWCGYKIQGTGREERTKSFSFVSPTLVAACAGHPHRCKEKQTSPGFSDLGVTLQSPLREMERGAWLAQ